MSSSAFAAPPRPQEFYGYPSETQPSGDPQAPPPLTYNYSSTLQPYGNQHAPAPPTYNSPGTLQSDIPPPGRYYQPQGQPYTLEAPPLFTPNHAGERIELAVPFPEPEPPQGPLAQGIYVDLLNEFTLTAQQPETSVPNDYWDGMSLDPALPTSGAAYDQSYFQNSEGEGRTFIGPDGQKARSGSVNAHRPGEEVDTSTHPMARRVMKRSSREFSRPRAGVIPPGAGYDGLERFKNRIDEGGLMHAVQPNSNDPSFGPEGEPFLNADRNHGDRPAYRKPSREPIPQGFAEKASGPIVEYTWPQPGRPSAVPPREKATSHLPPAAPPPRKVAKHQPPAQKTAVTAQTVATTPPKNVTKGEPAEQKRAVGTLTLDTMVMVTPTEYTTNQPTQGTLNVSLKRPATTITETIIPNELSVKLKELDGKLKGLGKGLRRLKPKIRSIVNHKKKKFQ